MVKEQIILSEVPKALNDAYGNTIPYTKLYRLVLDCVIPADKIGKSWYVSKGELPNIAEQFDLKKVA